MTISPIKELTERVRHPARPPVEDVNASVYPLFRSERNQLPSGTKVEGRDVRFEIVTHAPDGEIRSYE